MNCLVTTPMFGGQDGELFNDVFCTTKDGGGFLVKIDGESTGRAINMNHPIDTIVVHFETFICGMSVTYHPARRGEDPATFTRGNESLRKGRADFGVNEVLLAVFGRTGPISRNDSRQVVHKIGFILFNTADGTVRGCGPFGNSGNNGLGEPFYVTNVVGFGGFQGTSDIGLSGLCFVKDMNRM